jgi:hypothetical protein
MARILYWNINNFTNERIATNTKKRDRDDMEWGAGPRGPQHLQMILDTLGATVDPGTGAAVDLDFIVIVEVYARMGAPVEGQLIGGNGLTGCLNLFDEIDNNVPVIGQWAMVPPVVSGQDGQREAIAVYYRMDKWYFLGPNTWPAAYPGPLNARLPAGNIPAGYPYRPNQPENRSAGQSRFIQAMPPGFMGVPPLVNFPGAANRKPWLTAFGDVNNNNDLIRIMALHTKPNDRHGGPAYADQGTANLADVFAVTTRPPDAANQIDVIVGDFNVDNMVAGNFAAGGPFGRLIGLGANPVAPAYTPLVRPPAMLNPNYNSYYHTHGNPSDNRPDEVPARILEGTPNPPYWRPVGHYPGQEYSKLSIDNALVRYHGGAAPPANHNTTILSRVRQTPYNQPAGPPPVMPMLGHYQNVVWMDETIGNIYAMAPSFFFDLNERFRQWDNYGRVYSVSDHFALLFDV